MLAYFNLYVCHNFLIVKLMSRASQGFYQANIQHPPIENITRGSAFFDVHNSRRHKIISRPALRAIFLDQLKYSASFAAGG
jgi:hypothetical protein